MKIESSRQTFIEQTDRRTEISLSRAPVGAKKPVKLVIAPGAWLSWVPGCQNGSCSLKIPEQQLIFPILPWLHISGYWMIQEIKHYINIFPVQSLDHDFGKIERKYVELSVGRVYDRKISR